MTTTTNPTIIRPHIVWLGLSISSFGKHNMCSYYGWVCLRCHLFVNTICAYCVYWLTTTYDKANHNSTTYCAYWRTTTKINPPISQETTYFGFIVVVVRHQTQYMIVLWLGLSISSFGKHNMYCFTDGRQQGQTQPYYDHMLCLLTDDNSNKPIHYMST
jgi:hypothetical protein